MLPEQPFEQTTPGAFNAGAETHEAVAGGEGEVAESDPPSRAGKTRKERIHGKSQERVLQDLTDDRTIDAAIRESIRLHGA